MKNCVTLLILLLAFQLSGQNRDTVEKRILNDTITHQALPANSLTLAFCQEQTRLNYPLTGQKEILKNMSDMRLKNLDVNNLPQIFLNGQATVQTDVTRIPLSMPGLNIPDVNKDMYKLSLDFNQSIYNGGITKNLKKLEIISNETEQQNIEAELDKIREKVNQLYFSILILRESETVIELGIAELENKLRNIQSGIKNGTLPAINEDIIRVEILKLSSQLNETRLSRKNAVKMLGMYMNKELPDSVNLQIPSVDMTQNDGRRKEFELFDLQAKKLELSKSLIYGRTKPKLVVFAQLGYGRPGLNMLSNQFDPYAIGGIKLSWNIWNWNQNKNDIRLVNYQKAMIDNQREIFEKNQNLAGERYISEIDRLALLVKTDSEILQLREKILTAASSRFINGTMTSTEYITEKNAEMQARLNLKSHSLQHLKAMVDYLNHYNRFNLDTTKK